MHRCKGNFLQKSSSSICDLELTDIVPSSTLIYFMSALILFSFEKKKKKKKEQPCLKFSTRLRGENEVQNEVRTSWTVNEVSSTCLRDLEISSKVSGIAIMIIVFTAAIVLGESAIIARVHARSHP